MEAASLLPDLAAIHLRLVATEGAVIVLHVETVRPQVSAATRLTEGDLLGHAFAWNPTRVTVQQIGFR